MVNQGIVCSGRVGCLRRMYTNWSTHSMTQEKKKKDKPILERNSLNERYVETERKREREREREREGEGEGDRRGKVERGEST